MSLKDMAPDIDELNSIQDLVINTISIARDQISLQFTNHFNGDDLVDQTLRNLTSYMSSRSQTVSHLLSMSYHWDAEIILRSFYEACAKIWFFCAYPSEKRQDLAAEFWGEYAHMHNHKRATRSFDAWKSYVSDIPSVNEAIFAELMNEKVFNRGDSNKAQRRALEQRWSFVEIIKYIEEKSAPDFPLAGLGHLRHMYGLQSHLLHSDDFALDLMHDRAIRTEPSLTLLIQSHICRMFCDQVVLWNSCALAICYRYEIQTKLSVELSDMVLQVLDRTKPFLNQFDKDQAGLYGVKENNE